nr:AAA family ATPase [Armatimonas rosea]
MREITPGNLLSFGPNPEPIKLNQLNILIGANGSGKSNLIEVIHVLRSTPINLRKAFSPGFADWIWKGNPTESPELSAIIRYDAADKKFDLVHSLRFDSERPFVEIENEVIGIPYRNDDESTFYTRDGNIAILRSASGDDELVNEPLLKDSSILYQRQDPKRLPELYFLTQKYKFIRIYREWQFGRNSELRESHKTDLRHEVLEEDFSNLAMYLNYLRSFPPVRRKLIEKLQNVFAGITDFDVSVVGGTAQLYLIEGDYRIPATRLSDGTLRYLCLLAILCNPEPQPLICLEEPELGLHPDLLSGLVDLIKECSERTQMIVTTHSEFIVDGFSENPECVVVVDKEDGITKMKRLSHDSLKVWLEEYSLGQLWNRGQIGGTRW